MFKNIWKSLFRHSPNLAFNHDISLIFESLKKIPDLVGLLAFV